MAIERAYQATHIPTMTKEECLTIGILMGIYLATADEFVESARDTLEQYEASLVRKYRGTTFH